VAKRFVDCPAPTPASGAAEYGGVRGDIVDSCTIADDPGRFSTSAAQERPQPPVEEFRAAIAEGRQPVTNAASNLGSLALTIAAIEAAGTGPPQRIDRIIEGY
jgi:hypothetical protein